VPRGLVGSGDYRQRGIARAEHLTGGGFGFNSGTGKARSRGKSFGKLLDGEAELLRALAGAAVHLSGGSTAGQEVWCGGASGRGARDSTASWGLGLGFPGVRVPLFVGRQNGLDVRVGRGARQDSRAAGGARKEKRRRGEGGADGWGQRVRKRGEEAQLGWPMGGGERPMGQAGWAEGPSEAADGRKGGGRWAELGRGGRRERRAVRREKRGGMGFWLLFPNLLLFSFSS
jgi:hypothetical protein